MGFAFSGRARPSYPVSKGPSAMRHHARIAAALAAVALLAASFVAAAPAAADDPLRAHAAARGKFIGYAAATGPLANEAAYRSLAAAEFNQVTAENAMKWDATEPSDGSWNFTTISRQTAVLVLPEGAWDVGFSDIYDRIEQK